MGLVLRLKKKKTTLKVLLFPGSGSSRHNSFLMCIGPKPCGDLLSDQQEGLCQSPFITELSPAGALFRTEANSHSSHF